MNHICIVGGPKQFKTTFAFYQVYSYLNLDLKAFVICSEEKMLSNSNQFAKLMDVDPDILNRMQVKLIKSYTELQNTLAAMSQIQTDYDLVVIDDIYHFTQNQPNRLDLLLALIYQIKPKKNPNIPQQIFLCLQDPNLSCLQYHKYHEVVECKLLQGKLTVQLIQQVKILGQVSVIPGEQRFSEIVTQINNKIKL